MRSADRPPGWHLVKQCEDGGTVFGPSAKSERRHKESWPDKSRRYCEAITAEKLNELAVELGVSSQSLRDIGIGWNKSRRCWTFPERDGTGLVIGILTRNGSGAKKAMSGSKRGLIVPCVLDERPEIVLGVEGPSDVAACLTLGLTSVGRPSNIGGVNHLATLLQDREVLVVGENDNKPNGDWPGRDGAIRVAKQLARKWHCPVRWTMLPDGTKDVRQFLNDKALNLDDKRELDAVGRELLAILEQNATEIQPTNLDDDAQSRSRVTRLIEFASTAELFHDREQDAYATVSIDGHRETMPLRGKSFKRWLCRQYYADTGGAVNGQHLTDALNVINARAIFDGAELPVHVRIADHGGSIWIDLCDEQWRAIEVTTSGWRVVNNSPVKFIRHRGMLPLPIPVSGGSITELWPFINISSDHERILFVSAMVAAFRPQGPYIIIVLNGEAGSAKSTSCRIFRVCVDPNVSAIRGEPREVRDVMIGARNSWVFVLDNLSRIAPWLSDALCRLATGGGFATRELHTDTEQVLFDSQRPILLNGIDDLCSRGDLADRSIILTLNPIDEEKRRTESELWSEFSAVQPRIFGALLDSVSLALRDVAAVRLESHPRMADFAAWSYAAAPALGWSGDDFLAAYRENREQLVALTIESSPIGPAIIALMSTAGRNQWLGTAGDLLKTISTDDLSDERTRRRKDWPTSPRGLSGGLRRLAPELRKCGIDVSWDRDLSRKRRRLINIQNRREQPSEGVQRQSEITTVDANRTVADASRFDEPSDENSCGAIKNCSSDCLNRSDGCTRHNGRRNAKRATGEFIVPIDAVQGEEVDEWTS